MGNSDKNKNILARLEYLEENKRYFENALETVLSSAYFHKDMNHLRSPEHIMTETLTRISELIPFEACALYRLDEDTSDFYLSNSTPFNFRSQMEDRTKFLVSQGFFGWALHEQRGVTINADNHGHPEKILLHVIGANAQIWGMFIGVLGKHRLPEASRSLLSLILMNAANALENFENHSVIQGQKQFLSEKVEDRTRELAVKVQTLIAENQKRDQIEKELKQAKAEAEEANQAKTRFLVNMSHEIRTHMKRLHGALQVLKGSMLDSRQLEALSLIEKSSFEMLDLIDDIPFSKTDDRKKRGSEPIQEVPCQESKFIADTGDGVDLSAVIAKFGGDRGFFCELAELLILDTPSRIYELGSSLEKRDAEQMEKDAHNLKGASGNFGLEKLYALFSELQRLASEKKMDEAAGIYSKAVQEYRKVEAALKKSIADISQTDGT